MEAALSDISGINLVSGADSSLFQMRGLLQAVTPSAAEATRRIIDDKDENTVVKYGAQCSLRTRQVCIISSRMTLYCFIVHHAKWPIKHHFPRADIYVA